MTPFLTRPQGSATNLCSFCFLLPEEEAVEGPGEEAAHGLRPELGPIALRPRVCAGVWSLDPGPCPSCAPSARPRHI